jgi:hypothetical protein
MSEHAVLVSFQYGSTDLTPLFELEDLLTAAIDDAEVGEYDGHEIAIDASGGKLFMYGPDADALFGAVEAILKSTRFLKGAEITKRYGKPGAREAKLTL